MSRLALAASTRLIAWLVANCGLATIVFGTLGSTAAQAQQREFAAIVIVACDHSGRTTLATRVSGVETAGHVPGRLAAALQVESSCAEIFNLLTHERFELIHRLTAAPGDYNGDGDTDGRDFVMWRRGGSPAGAGPSPRATTVLVRCEYVVAGRLITRVTGSEIAGPIDAPLAAALAARPSCAEAYAALAAVGFGLVSAAPAPAADGVHSSDLAFWGDRTYTGSY